MPEPLCGPVTEQSAGQSPSPPWRRDTGVMQPTMTDLRNHYVHRVNSAVAADRPDMIRELNESYVEEALRLILATA